MLSHFPSDVNETLVAVRGYLYRQEYIIEGEGRVSYSIYHCANALWIIKFVKLRKTRFTVLNSLLQRGCECLLSIASCHDDGCHAPLSALPAFKSDGADSHYSCSSWEASLAAVARRRRQPIMQQ